MGSWSETWQRFHGRGVYPAELAFLLRIPLRELVFSTRQLIERLRLRPDSAVLEIGPGPGYFSPAVASTVPRGRLELLDLQPAMLRKARRRVRRANGANVHYTCASASRLPYADGVFDAVFMVAVLGEVDDPEGCLREVVRVLRPGGLLSVTELPGDPDALARETVESLARPTGLRPFDFLAVRRGFSLTLQLPVLATGPEGAG